MGTWQRDAGLDVTSPVARAQAEGRGLDAAEQAAIWAARTAKLRFPANAPDPFGTGGGNGALADAHTVVERGVAGRWLTADYQMGDVLLFSIYTMHASTDNNGREERLSTDTRYQRAAGRMPRGAGRGGSSPPLGTLARPS